MPLAAIIERPGHLATRNLPAARPEPGGVVLNTILSEVCGTDVHLFHGRLEGVPYPLVPGHVSVGQVIHVEGSAQDVNGRPVAPGQFVSFLDVWGTCGACWHCLVAEAPNRCPERKVYGITLGAEDGLFGGWCEQIYLRPGVRILPLDNVPVEAYMGGGCGLATALHAVEQSGIRFGDTVLVQGSGPVGLNALLLSRLKGATRLLMIGGGADERREMAQTLGADLWLDVFETTPQEREHAVRDATMGRGADVVIEASGAASAVPEGFKLARDAGTYVIVGHYSDQGEVSINAHTDINRKHLRVQGVWGTAFTHVYRSLQMLERYHEEVPWARFLSRTYSLHEMEQALSDVEQARVLKAAVAP